MAKPRTTRDGMLDLMYEQKLPFEVMLKAYLLFIGGTCKRTGRPFAVIRLDTLQTELRLKDKTPNEVEETLKRIGAEAGFTPNKNPRYGDCPGYYLNWLAPPKVTEATSVTEVTEVTSVTEVTRVTNTPSRESSRTSDGTPCETPSQAPISERARVESYRPKGEKSAAEVVEEARKLARDATLASGR